LIGQTAQLEFKELKPEATQAASFADFQSTGLTGKDLTKSEVKFDPNSGEPGVGLNFSAEGMKKFSEITGRNIGKRVAIFLDEMPVTAPQVQERITTGEAGATLGAESVQKSVQAGLIGLLMVVIFMAAYYGRLGLLADVALIIYGLLTLALYKLIPITLTLPGIAGFIISIGMAVDANILIFERM